MSNIKFNYLYRDGSNYKKWADVVFFNPHGVPLSVASEAIRNVLWGDDLFIAHQIRVPEVFLFAKGDITSDDHCFHEFCDVELSDRVPTDQYGRTMSEFIAEIIKEAKDGWRVFDPLDRIS
jgi:hypothetical protein